jgi:hypothetical protein
MPPFASVGLNHPIAEKLRQGGTDDPAVRSPKHFERARELSGCKLASPFVSFAGAVSVTRQDPGQFETDRKNKRACTEFQLNS